MSLQLTIDTKRASEEVTIPPGLFLDDPEPFLTIMEPKKYNPSCHQGGGFMGGSVHPYGKNWKISIYWEGIRYIIKRHPATNEPFYSQRAAEKQLDMIRCEIDDKSFNPKAWLPDSPLSTRIYCEDWLNIIDVQPKTLEHHYKPAVKYHISPYFGDKDIRKIRYNDIVKFKNHLFKEKGLKEKSVYNYINVLKKILHDARRNVDIKSVPPFPELSISLPEILYLTKDQQDKMINAMPKRDRPVFQIAMEYGLRNQEVRALQKDCITDNEIYIRRAFTYHKGHEVLRETTKTGDKGKRIFGLTTSARKALKSITPHISPFVFVRRNGMPYRNKDLNRIWHEAEKKMGIKCKLQNALRHSLGCQLLDEGVDMDIVRDIYGHTNPKITQRYAKRSRLTVTEVLEKRGKIVKFKKNYKK